MEFTSSSKQSQLHKSESSSAFDHVRRDAEAKEKQQGKDIGNRKVSGEKTSRHSLSNRWTPSQLLRKVSSLTNLQSLSDPSNEPGPKDLGDHSSAQTRRESQDLSQRSERWAASGSGRKKSESRLRYQPEGVSSSQPQENQSLKSQLEQTDQEKETLAQENQSLQSRNEDLKGQLTHKELSMEVLSSRLQQAGQENRILKHQMDTVSQQQSKLEHHLNQVRERYSHLELQLVQARAHHSDLQHQLEQKQQRIEHLNKEKEQLQLQLTQAHAHYSDLQQQQQQKQQDIERLNNEKADLERQPQEYQRKIEHLNQQHQDLERKNQQSYKMIEQLNYDKEGLLDALNEQLEQKDNLQQRIKELELQLRKYDEEKHLLVHHCNILVESKENLESYKEYQERKKQIKHEQKSKLGIFKDIWSKHQKEWKKSLEKQYDREKEKFIFDQKEAFKNAEQEYQRKMSQIKDERNKQLQGLNNISDNDNVKEKYSEYYKLRDGLNEWRTQEHLKIIEEFGRKINDLEQWHKETIEQEKQKWDDAYKNSVEKTKREYKQKLDQEKEIWEKRYHSSLAEIGQKLGKVLQENFELNEKYRKVVHQLTEIERKFKYFYHLRSLDDIEDYWQRHHLSREDISSKALEAFNAMRMLEGETMEREILSLSYLPHEGTSWSNDDTQLFPNRADNSNRSSIISEQSLLAIETTQKDKGKAIIVSGQGNPEQGDSSNARAIVSMPTDGTLQNTSSGLDRHALIAHPESQIAKQIDSIIENTHKTAESQGILDGLSQAVKPIAALFHEHIHQEKVINSVTVELMIASKMTDFWYDEGQKALEHVYTKANKMFEENEQKLNSTLEESELGSKKFELAKFNLNRLDQRKKDYIEHHKALILNTKAKTTAFSAELNRQLKSFAHTTKGTEIADGISGAISAYLFKFG